MVSLSFLFSFVVALTIFTTVSFATYGLDVSQSTSVSSFQCLKSNSYSFAIVRVYQSNGVVDPNGAQTIANAWSGGMSHVDGYIFPCYSCGSPAGQMDAAINSLKSSGVTYASRNSTANLASTYGIVFFLFFLFGSL